MKINNYIMHIDVIIVIQRNRLWVNSVALYHTTLDTPALCSYLCGV